MWGKIDGSWIVQETVYERVLFKQRNNHLVYVNLPERPGYQLLWRIVGPAIESATRDFIYDESGEHIGFSEPRTILKFGPI